VLAAVWFTLAMFEMPLAAAAVAGAAVSVPVIIHLLNRKRFRVVSWAAMRFLLAAQRKNSRRMRLEQFLLLLVRCLLLLLLALAMCSVTDWGESIWRTLLPRATGAPAAFSQRTHKVVVIDGSVSMGVKVGNDTAFTRARDLASKMVRESPRGDGFTVVLLTSPPRTIVTEPSDDPRKVAAVIDELRMPHGNGDLQACLSTIEGLLQKSPEKFLEKEVYFFTDLQYSTWVGRQAFNLSPQLRGARTILVDVGNENQGNVAVTNLALADDLVTTKNTCILIATIRNFNAENREGVPVRLLVGRARETAKEPAFELRQVQERLVRLERDQETTVAFDVKFPLPGDYVVQVQVQNDALTMDDVRSAVVSVKKDLPVLLVNGKSFGDPFDQSAEWLRLALNPFTKPEEGTSVVRPQQINTTDFADPKKYPLDGYDCVFLCDVPSLSVDEKQRLDAHLRRGGGVVFCLGGQVQAGEYNRVLFQEGSWMLPVPLVNSQGSGPLHHYQLNADRESERLPPLKAFQGDNDKLTLLAPRFTRFWQTGNPPPGMKPRHVLSFIPTPIPGKDLEAPKDKTPPSGPAILAWNPPSPLPPPERNPGLDGVQPAKIGATPSHPQPRLRGRVVMITTGVNSEWSNWPASPSYPALMNELLYFASAGRLQEQSIEVGQAIELYLPLVAEVEATIETPDGRTEKVQTQKLDAGDSVLHWSDNDVSGIYRIRLGQHPREYLFAVNVPALQPSREGSESDLRRASPDDLHKSFPEGKLQIVRELREITRTAVGQTQGDIVYQPWGPVIARWMLLICLALVLVEVVLAFVFGHYSGAASPTDQPKPLKAGWALRTLAAMPWVLLVLGLGLGYIMADEAIHGDLFHFLGDSPRRAIEKLLGVPAPAVGEGARWRLEYNTYFLGNGADPWLAGGVLLGGAVLVWFLYLREGRQPRLVERLVMMGLRIGLILLFLGIFLPQIKVHFDRESWPDVVILIDDSQSMSAKERYADNDVREAADALAGEAVRLAEAKRNQARKKDKQAQEIEEEAQRRTPDDPEREGLLKDADILQKQAHELEADADALEKAKDGSELQRLHLVQALTTRGDAAWLANLIQQRRVKVHVFHCSVEAGHLTQITTPDELSRAGEAVEGLTASPRNNASKLGLAVRQVIHRFRASSLSAVIMFTDGVTTRDEDLPQAAKYAARMGVPLYFVGVGDAHEVRDIYLHDLQAEDSVYVNDKMIFELKVTGKGYKNLTVPVTLREKIKGKGKGEVLDTQMVQLDPTGKPVKVRLQHQPKEPGEKTYVIETPVQKDEVEEDNNRLEKAVSVRESKLIKVLYVEGYRRYEYHYLKTLLERESNRIKGNKTVELRVVLLDADPGYALSDRTALPEFPTRKELDAYDVVILGDVDPRGSAKMKEEQFKDLADFVRERGGGLLMVAGERFSPLAYRNSPLKDVMPVDVVVEEKDIADAPRQDGYRLEMTPGGRLHPIFRFSPEEKENNELWDHLREMYWWSEGYVPKRAAEVLAVHPTVKRADRKGADREDKEGTVVDKHPLVVQQFVGSGRTMFFGFSESWRWGFREDQVRYNQFWIQTVRYLARSRLGRIDLKLDRQTNYREGEPIKLTVRFPDDAPPPGNDTEVKVIMERKTPAKDGKPASTTTSPIILARVEGSRSAFEHIETQTPEGEYSFKLFKPSVLPDPPKAECKVVAPPGEMYGLRMNQPDMEAAAAESHGKFYTLATADKLWQELQVANRITVSSSGPPTKAWNNVGFYLVALLLLTTEWLLRKQKNLL
jgi:Aerotolerance regulator N-terminal/von Willebrand factor type A domain